MCQGDAPFSERPQLNPTSPLAKQAAIAGKMTQVQSSFDHAMRKAALLYNPDSGGSSKRRQSELESVVSLLRNAGVEAQLVLNHSREEAEEKARQAVLAGCDTVFACGGDGTIHNIVQVLANTPVALAVLPMGTANALAHDLGLPMHAVEATRAVLHGNLRRIALGYVQYLDLNGQPGCRYFVIAAGIGVDAHLFYRLGTGTKRRLGMAAYYAKAWHLWFTYHMQRFQVEANETGSHHPRCAEVTELLAVRVSNFGGVLQKLAPGASLDRDDLRLIGCRTASRFAYLSYVTRALLRGHWTVAGIDLSHAGKAVCQYLPAPPNSSNSSSAQPRIKIFVEADGELLGTLPAEITVVPDALTLIAPAPMDLVR